MTSPVLSDEARALAGYLAAAYVDGVGATEDGTVPLTPSALAGLIRTAMQLALELAARGAAEAER